MGMGKRRQHFVPQFYLRGFQCDAGKVFVLDKASKKTFKRPIPSFCQREYLYESESNDPNWHAGKYVAPSYNEDRLSEMERSFAPALSRVAKLCVPNTRFMNISEEDVGTLSSFVANLIVRNPEILFPLQSDLIASSRPKDLAPYWGVAKLLGLDAAFGGILKESVTRKLLLATAATDECSFQGALAADLDNMEGVVIRAPKGVPFVTASFPVFPVIGDVCGSEQLASLYFPLCSDAAIIYGASERSGIRRCVSVGADVVGRLNAACFASGYGEFLIAENEEALKASLGLAEALWPSLFSSQSRQ